MAFGRGRSLPTSPDNDAGAWIERYASHHGMIAIAQDPDGSSGLFTVFNPNNDLKVQIASKQNGEVWSWLVTAKDGTKNFYGSSDHAGLIQNLGKSSERKSLWYLDEVRDLHGNTVRYFYEHYPLPGLPSPSEPYRHPVLRAVEYGMTIGTSQAATHHVVFFSYTESAWKRTSHSHGTRTDFAVLLSQVCALSKTRVVGTGDKKFEAEGFDEDAPFSGSGVVVNHCYALTYKSGYSGRPLLASVEQRGAAESLPPWTFSYSEEDESFVDVLRSASSPSKVLPLPEGIDLSRATQDTEQMLADLDGDGDIDVIEGSGSDRFAVQLFETPADDTGVPTYEVQNHGWRNPLRKHAVPMQLEVLLDKSDTGGGGNVPGKPDCWNRWELELGWNAAATGHLLGYAQPLTEAPNSLFWMMRTSSPFPVHDEMEPYPEPLGAFQFLSSTYRGPYPGVGTKVNDFTSHARYINQLGAFGAYKVGKGKQYAFDWRTSDCYDVGQAYEIDYCWDVGTGRQDTIGEGLGCLDHAGGRWFADVILEQERAGYAEKLWDLADLDGDGLLDWVYAANVIQRTSGGTLRALDGGANDWYWARGNGRGWDAPQPWSMPSKLGPSSDTSDGIDFVHNTGLLSTGVTVSDRKVLRQTGMSGYTGGNAGFSGWSVEAGVAVNSNGVEIALASYGQGWGGGNAGGSVVGVNAATRSAGMAARQIARFALTTAAKTTNRVIASGDSQLAKVVRTANVVAGIVTDPAGAATSRMNHSWRLRTNGEFSFTLPLVGDVTRFARKKFHSKTVNYQGLVDLNADGCPDFVSTRFDAGSTLNDEATWLLFRNSGDGFEPPEEFSFANAWSSAFAIEGSAETRGLSFAETYNYLGARGAGETVRYGKTITNFGLRDLNGDGLPDFVTAATNDSWVVFFNEGNGFSNKTSWHFDGVGGSGDPCNGLWRPYLTQTIYGPNMSYQSSSSREVQGLFDANGDGLLDYWYVRPTPGGSFGSCAYVDQHSTLSRIEERVDPYALDEPLLVRLNTGHGFGEAREWARGGAPAFGGGITGPDPTWDPADRENPVGVVAYAKVGVMDADDDGAMDLVVRTGDGLELRPVAKPNFDRLIAVTTPFGGQLSVDYTRKKDRAGRQGQAQTVVDAIRWQDMRDDDAAQDVTFEYDYAGGKYSRAYREFWGFEYIYRSTKPADATSRAQGYTVSRYLQEKGFAGLLYCREVVAQDTSAIADLVVDLDERWRGVAEGDVPAGYARATAFGDPATAGATSKPKVSEDSAGESTIREDAGGTVADAHRPWAEIPAGPYAGNRASDTSNEPPEVAVNDVDDEYTYPEAGLTADALPTSSMPPEDSEHPGDLDGDPIGDTADVTGLGDSLYSPSASVTPGPYGTLDLLAPDADVPWGVPRCAPPLDSGARIVSQPFHYYADYSGIAEVQTPRLIAGEQRTFDATGANPMIAATRTEFGAYGNTVKVRDLGDPDVDEDDLTTETTYVPDDGDYVVSLPCTSITTDASGTVLAAQRFGYDAQLANGVCTAASKGELTETQAAVDGSTWVKESFEFSDEGMLTAHVDGRGTKTEYLYDDEDFPWLKTGERIEVTGEIAGTPTAHTLETTSTFTGVGSDRSTTNFGLLRSETDANGQTTNYAYDSLGRPTAVSRPGVGRYYSAQTEYQDGTFPRVAVTRTLLDRTVSRSSRGSRGGTVTSREVESWSYHDGLGRVFRTEGTPADNLAGCVAGSCRVVPAVRSFDDAGRVIRQLAPYFESDVPSDPVALDVAYDIAGRLVQSTGPNGGVTTVANDRNLVTTQDPDGRISFAERDARGWTVGSANYIDGAKYAETRYLYRADGKLITIVDVEGNRWTMRYDRLGRLVFLDDPDSGTRHNVHDATGNIVLSWGPRFATEGAAVSFAYDELGRLTRMTEHLGASLSGAAAVGGEKVSESRWFYDDDPDVVATGLGESSALQDCTDSQALGRLTRAEHRQDIEGAWTLVGVEERCWDHRGRLSELAQIIDGTPYRFSATYNELDLPVTETYPDGEVITYAYDAAGLSSSISHDSLGPIVQESMRSATGLLTRRQLGTLIQQDFCFDRSSGLAPSLGRMVTSKIANAVNTTCSDSAGEHVVTGIPVHDLAITTTPGGRVATRTEATALSSGSRRTHAEYGYDTVGRLISETLTVDAEPAVVTDFGYDVLDNLTGLGPVVQNYGGPNAGPHALTSRSGRYNFRYDAAGNMVRIARGRRVFRRLSWMPAGKLRYVKGSGHRVLSAAGYDHAGTRILKRTDSGDTHYAGPHRRSPDGAVEARYGSAGIRHTSAAGSSALYFSVRDPAQSTALILSAAGEVAQRVEYEPYGRPRTNEVTTAGGYETERLFNGKERESGFGKSANVYDFGARPYNANTGRWMSPDPSYADGLNRYAFVRNDPMSRWDPTGLGGEYIETTENIDLNSDDAKDGERVTRSSGAGETFKSRYLN